VPSHKHLYYNSICNFPACKNSQDKEQNPKEGIIFELYINERMEHGLILSNINKHISLNKEETDYFTSLLEFKKTKKKDCLLKEGQSCSTISYVHSGALRAFRQNKGV
jgi:hypothetical protein